MREETEDTPAALPHFEMTKFFACLGCSCLIPNSRGRDQSIPATIRCHTQYPQRNEPRERTCRRFCFALVRCSTCFVEIISLSANEVGGEGRGEVALSSAAPHPAPLPALRCKERE